MATPKRKAEEDAERDDADAKLARVPESEDDSMAAKEQPAAAGDGKGYVACLHEVSYPDGYDRSGRFPG